MAMPATPVQLGSTWTISTWFQMPLATGGNWNVLAASDGSDDDHVVVKRSTGDLGQ